MGYQSKLSEISGCAPLRNGPCVAASHITAVAATLTPTVAAAAVGPESTRLWQQDQLAWPEGLKRHGSRQRQASEVRLVFPVGHGVTVLVSMSTNDDYLGPKDLDDKVPELHNVKPQEMVWSAPLVTV